MHVYAKMYIDGKEYNVLQLDFGFDQKIRTNGATCALPQGGLFNIKLDADNDMLFYRWAASNEMRKKVKLVFYPITNDRKSRTIELFDTQCIKYDCDFSASNTDPIITTIRLSPGIIIQDGQVMVKKWWSLTDLSNYNAPKETPQEEVFHEFYILDEKNQRIEEINREQEIELVIKTSAKIGKTINVDLHNETYDFLHNGEVLTDDTLKDYVIQKDIERVPLKTILPSKN